MKINRTTVVICLAWITLTTAYDSGIRPGYLSEQGWRMLFTFDSPLVNPSFIQQTQFPQARTVFASVLNTFYYSEAGVAVPVGPLNSLGLSYSGEFSQKIRETVLKNDVPVPTGALVGSSGHTLSLSLAHQLLGSLSTGINYFFLADENFDNRIVHGLDIGTSTRTSFGSAGLSLRTMYSSGSTFNRGFFHDITLTAEPHLPGGIIDAGVSLSVHDPGHSSSDASVWHTGGKIGIKIPGVASFALTGEFTTGGFASGGVYGVFDLSSLNRNREFLVGAQYSTILPGEATGYSFYIKKQFGPARFNDKDLFDQARRLFYKNEYADALVTFGKLLTLYPAYSSTDIVYSYMARSLFHMGMYKKSIEVCYSGIEQFAGSHVAHQLRLLLLEIASRRNERYQLQKAWSELQAHDPPDSLAFHGAYRYAFDLLGQGHSDSAYIILSRIPFDHPDGPYALLSKAQCAVIMGRISETIKLLDFILDSTDRQIITSNELACRAAFMRGLLCLEFRDSLHDGVAQAIASLERIGKNCSLYGQARAALGWTAFYKNDHADMMQHAKFLIQNGETRIDQIEGGLLFALAAQNEQGIALKTLSILDTAIQPGPSDDTLRSELSAIKTEMIAASQSLESLADTLYTLSRTPRVPWIDTEIGRAIRRYKVRSAKFHQLSNRYFYASNNLRRDASNREWLQAELPYVIAQIMSRR